MEFSLFLVLFVAYFTSYINAEVETPVVLPITGGNLAHKNQFKYQVSLQRNGAHRCGGGIIADQFVLTAAHCVINRNSGEFREGPITVLAGVLDANHEKGVEAEVEAIYVPKIYVYVRISIGDIAVLKLKNALGLDKNEYLRLPMKIKWNYPSYANEKAIVTGYGWNNNTVRLNDDGTPVTTGSSDWRLRFTEAEIINHTQCKSIFNKIDTISREIICAKMNQSRYNVSHGTCRGDSGGPLVVRFNLVVGVASTSIDCSERIYPGKYTRVSSFVPFINNVLKGNRTSDMRVATWNESWWTRWIPFVNPKFVEN